MSEKSKGWIQTFRIWRMRIVLLLLIIICFMKGYELSPLLTIIFIATAIGSSIFYWLRKRKKSPKHLDHLITIIFIASSFNAFANEDCSDLTSRESLAKPIMVSDLNSYSYEKLVACMPERLKKLGIPMLKGYSKIVELETPFVMFTARYQCPDGAFRIGLEEAKDSQGTEIYLIACYVESSKQAWLRSRAIEPLPKVPEYDSDKGVLIPHGWVFEWYRDTKSLKQVQRYYEGRVCAHKKRYFQDPSIKVLLDQRHVKNPWIHDDQYDEEIIKFNRPPNGATHGAPIAETVLADAACSDTSPQFGDFSERQTKNPLDHMGGNYTIEKSPFGIGASDSPPGVLDKIKAWFTGSK